MSFLGGIENSLDGDTSGAYSNYSDEQRQLAQDLNPYIKDGKISLNNLLSQFQKETNNPAFLENELASSYKPSDYYKQQAKYLTGQLNSNAAAEGTLGGSYAANNMAATDDRLLSQDENNYIDKGMQTYGQGISGEEGINNEGFNALGQQNNLLTAANQAEMQGKIAHDNAQTALLGEGLNLGSEFFTGGAGGLSTLIGGLGKDMMPSDISSEFGGGNQKLIDAINELKQAGLWQ